MPKRKSSSTQGISLVEIIVVIFLIALFSVVLMNVFITHGRLTTAGLKTSEMHLHRVQIERDIKGVIRIATQVMGSQTVGGTLYTTDENTMIFQIPSLDSSGVPIADTFDYAVFHLDPSDPSELFYSREPNPASSRSVINKLLSNKVDKLNFIFDEEVVENSNRVIVNITLRDTYLDTSKEVKINLQLKLGNKLYE